MMSQSPTEEPPIEPPPHAGYRVLARKYRPATFDDLIGQDAMVRTISNAFESGRIPQAWILTGVRGVGKTTTARILARALNYELPDGSVTAPTIDMPAHGRALPGDHREPPYRRDRDGRRLAQRRRGRAPDQRRHPLRAGVSARYKVYILDEVHMLSGAAFNALLKTLEEPPPHAKFIFATTEIRKVPVTVLSRCQRFDLRRVDAALLVQHLEGIAAKEKIEVEPAALALIARAAEGSVRDALSLLDQAIAHAAQVPVRAEDVRQMLGPCRPRAHHRSVRGADAGRCRGGAEGTARAIRHRRRSGGGAGRSRRVHPFRHPREDRAGGRRRHLAVGGRAHARPRFRGEAVHARAVARLADAAQGHRRGAGARPAVAAAEMVLVRIAYAADLPTPDEVVRVARRDGGAPRARQGNGGGAQAVAQARRAALRRAARRPAHLGGAVAAPGRRSGRAGRRRRAARRRSPSARFEELIALAADKRDITVKMALERDVRLVRCEDGQLEIALEPSAPKTLVHDLSRKFSAWTGRRWMVVVSKEQGAPTLRAQAEARQAEIERGVRADPLVQAVLNRFPGAKIVGVTQVRRPRGRWRRRAVAETYRRQ